MSTSSIKTELINDLISISTVMDEVYKYHPDNPNKLDVVEEYKVLFDIKEEIEKQLKEYVK